ncbi:aldo/keto reductase [Streptomyces sp. NPDC026589]|uniref:aldo/keto reductase n=1 Tax=Streptomyces sp. NPDC026589 TaxID=3155609 RepID=UPI0033E0DC47
MKYRTLGNSGMAVSKIALGTMYFGSENTEDEAFALLDAFVEAGGTVLDTSDVYSDTLAEQTVGRWLAARPSEITDRVVLATKGRYTTGPDVNDVGLSRRHLTRALDASLHRLGVERVDLYQMHGWDAHTPIEETLSFLDGAIRAGKIYYAGLSNFTGWQLQLTVSTAKAMGVNVPLTLQQQYSLLSRESEYEMVPAALHNHIGLLPWSPLAGGFLTGKYRRGTTPAPDTRAGGDNPLYRYVSAQYSASDRNWATIDETVRIAQEAGVTPAQVALSWIADRPGVVAPVYGARTLDQLHDGIAAADLTLDDEATHALDKVSAPTPGDYPYGPFGVAQRDRRLQGGDQALGDLVSQGSDHPLGQS